MSIDIKNLGRKTMHELVIKRPKKKRNQKNGKDLASFLETINYARVPYDR